MHSYLPLRNTVKYIQMLFQANVFFSSAQAAFLNFSTEFHQVHTEISL